MNALRKNCTITLPACTSKEQSDTSSFTRSSRSSSSIISSTNTDHENDNDSDTDNDTDTDIYNNNNKNNHNDAVKNSSRESITTAASIDLTNDCDNNKILTGVIVNGFHPQLHTWKETNHHNHNLTMNRYINNNNKIHSLKRCRSTASLDEKIQQRVSRARNETVQDLNNIQLAIENSDGLHVPFVVEAGTASAAAAETLMITRDNNNGGENDEDESSIRNLYTDLFEKSNVPQLITAPGGRIAAGNQKFMEILGFGGSLQSLTAFDIVTPSMIPKLYEIFLIALQPHDDESIDENDVKYPSLTVPCTQIGTGDLSYYITFSLMYDQDPEKRCFHCMLSTTHDMPIGNIYSVSQKYLLEML